MAWSSLEELKNDYRDFLRQRGLTLLPSAHPALMRFKGMCCATLDDVSCWVVEEQQLAQLGKSSDNESRQEILSSSALVENAALSLLNLCCYLLDQQLKSLAADFEQAGGFTERLHRIGSVKRKEM